mgnify:CR=1 FL=1
MYCIRVNKIRNVIAYISAGAVMVATITLMVQWIAGGCESIELYYHVETLDRIILVFELLCMVIITYLCFKYKKYIISVLTIFPTLLVAWLELFGPQRATIYHIYIDHLAILMCLIVGIIGSLIIIYAVGYMHGYHHHHTEFEDRRNYFFMLLFLFLGAMFGFVMSESTLWVDAFWEVTSICSFLLIGYTKTPEAITNSFRALWMNLLGGTALAIGVTYQVIITGNDSMEQLVRGAMAGHPGAVIPVALIAFAALTKSAQLPFSKWLMGAMVAPTPSSALLHSATMVKAGIYILYRLSPAMDGHQIGIMIGFVGGFTFLAASIMAIAQSDGKKVLAFFHDLQPGIDGGLRRRRQAGDHLGRTVSDDFPRRVQIPAVPGRGCGGKFHALQRCGGYARADLPAAEAGTVHVHRHRRHVSGAFGMLISKWSALKASVDADNIMMVIFIAYGSATTMFYWTKWMSKLISATNEPRIKDITKKNEMISLTVHAVLMVLLCLLFPVISKVFVEPLMLEMFGVYVSVLPVSVMYMLVILICFIFAVPMIAYVHTRRMQTSRKLSYMNGVNEGDNVSFTDSFGEPKKLVMSKLVFPRTFSG